MENVHWGVGMPGGGQSVLITHGWISPSAEEPCCGASREPPRALHGPACEGPDGHIRAALSSVESLSPAQGTARSRAKCLRPVLPPRHSHHRLLLPGSHLVCHALLLLDPTQPSASMTTTAPPRVRATSKRPPATSPGP